MLKTAKPARSHSARRQRQRARIRAKRLAPPKRRQLRGEWKRWLKMLRVLGVQLPVRRTQLAKWGIWLKNEQRLEQLYPGLPAVYRETVRMALDQQVQTGRVMVDLPLLQCRAMEMYLSGTFAGPLIQNPRSPDLQKTCPDCGVEIGAFHKPGCDVDLCPFCGIQMLQDECCYEYFGINVETMKQDHPEMYEHGLPGKMQEEYEEYLRPHLLPWDGVWPGVKECREYGLWCKWTATGWQTCDPNDPGATEDLNELKRRASWDKEQRRFVLSSS